MKDTPIPTPRTDEFVTTWDFYNDPFEAIDHAQTLETELTAVTEQRDGLRSGIDYASDQLTKVIEERDRLAEALDRIIDYQGRFAEEDPESIAKEALKSLAPNK